MAKQTEGLTREQMEEFVSYFEVQESRGAATRTTVEKIRLMRDMALRALDTPNNAAGKSPNPAPNASEPRVPNGTYREVVLVSPADREAHPAGIEPYGVKQAAAFAKKIEGILNEPTPESAMLGTNLQAILDGRVSGHFTEWPQVRVELRELVRRLDAAHPSGQDTVRVPDLAQIDAMIKAWFEAANKPGATFVSRMQAALAARPDAAAPSPVARSAVEEQPIVEEVLKSPHEASTP